MLTIVAPVRLISGQKLLTENRRSIAGVTAGQQRADDTHRDRVEVEQRQRREHDIVGAALPRTCDLVGQAHDVVVREHAALGRTGRARGVDEAREIAGPHVGVGDRVVASGVERVLPRHDGPRVDHRVGRVDGDAVRQRGRALVADDFDRA